MRRYADPLPQRPAPAARSGDTALLERLLEETCRQNQLLLDLVAGVNALTGAVLTRK